MTQVDVDTFTEIRDKFDSEPACEHSDHSTDDGAHYGPAAWHVNTVCPNCTVERRMLVCQGWYEFASSPLPYMVQHFQCGYWFTVQEYFRQSTWVRL